MSCTASERISAPANSPFLVSGGAFDPARDDAIVRLNTTEEWVIRNSSTVWHPFHIHINQYQVVAFNGHLVLVRSWEDTTPVPPLGDITIRTRFLDFPGAVGLPLSFPLSRGSRHDGDGPSPLLTRMGLIPERRAIRWETA